MVLIRLAVPALAAALLYVYGLASVGVLSTDEPRYISIGREMARSGDWITPRLWGQAWFEKPPLLYWLIAAATRAGLRDEWAARLPVALMSLAFLAFYFRRLEREFGRAPAAYATVILGTSAGWLAYSRLALTDIPMAAALSAAMLFALRSEAGAGPLLGVAILAKSLVPAILAAPLVWWGRRRPRDLLVVALAATIVAAPWYVLCYARNGREFLDVLFVRHQLARFANGEMHPQPFWFYLPVLAAGLFPWTPLVPLLAARQNWRDPVRRYFLIWAAFGFAFFSASSGKLPGYLLPILPPVAALLGVALDQSRWPRVLLTASLLVCLAATPVLVDSVAEVHNSGLSRAAIHIDLRQVVLWLTAALAIAITAIRGVPVPVAFRRVALAVVAVFAFSLPQINLALDRESSVRLLWQTLIAPQRDLVCVEEIHRKWRYGLNYYSVDPLPACEVQDRRLHLRQLEGSQKLELTASPRE